MTLHHRTVALAAWLLLHLAGPAAAGMKSLPTPPGPVFPVFANPEQVKSACDEGLEAANEAVKALEKRPGGRGWLRAYDDVNALFEDKAGAIYLLSNVHPDKAIREATEACERRWQDFSTTLAQNETLFKAAKATAAVPGADAIDRHYLKTTLEAFEDAGVSLPPAARARAKAILDRVNELAQTFDKNIRDEGVVLAFAEAELAGVPDSVWKANKRDAQGRVLLGLDGPSYTPVMQSATNGATRQRMWRAKTDEGGAPNLKLLAEIGQLRKEYAGLFGATGYAEFLLKRRMARTPAAADRFLDDVKAAVATREKAEIEELRAAKAQHLGTPLVDTKIERWDVSFYTERLKRERYSVDQDAFKPYFPPQPSMALVMRIVEKTMGVRFTLMPSVKPWHNEVQTWVVSEAAAGQKPLATLYVDLHPRDGKYNHAAVWSFRGGAAPTGRVPQAALVVNFDRAGLTLDELETLLHEFGHAVHSTLSATRYSGQAGTNTLRDFVEAPSQMLEEWVYDRAVLDLMQAVCPSCKRVPDELLQQAIKARHYGKGIRYARQHLYAAYDLALHAADAPEPMATWARMEGATPLGHVAGSMFPAGFSHVAGGYAASYYGYLWSEVIAADLRTAFAKNKLSPQVGMRYRQTVLANGGQLPADELVKQFLGREGNAKAFFGELNEGGKR